MSESQLRTFLVTRTVWSLVFKVFAAGISVLTTLLLARLLGAEGYGTYAYAMAWLGLLSGISVFGIDRLLIRLVAVYRSRKSWDLLRGLLAWSGRAAFLGSVVVVLLALACLLEFGPADENTRLTVGIALIALPAVVLARLRRAALQGLERVLTAQFPESVLHPVLFLALLLSLVSVFQVQAESWHAVLLYVGTYAVTFLVGTALLWKAIPTEARSASPTVEGPGWLRATSPLFLAGVLGAANAQGETLVLGMLDGGRSVGYYVVALRLAGLVSFVLVAVNVVLPPLFARMHEEKDYEGLRSLTVRSAQVPLLVSLPVATLFVFAGEQILGLFGEEFVAGRTALLILSAAQLVNVGSGSVGYLLIMTGHAKKAVIGQGIGATMNLLLASAMIPRWGVEGAAVASAASLVLRNAFLAFAVRKDLGFAPTALGSLWRWRG